MTNHHVGDGLVNHYLLVFSFCTWEIPVTTRILSQKPVWGVLAFLGEKVTGNW